MIKKYHIALSFKWFDFWVGFFIDRLGKILYIGLLPMLPIKIWFTEHLRCPECEKPMQKTAFFTDDGWLLEWECEDCEYSTEDGYPWPYGDEILTDKDLKRRGFLVV